MAEPRTRDLDTMVSLIHAHAEGYVAESATPFPPSPHPSPRPLSLSLPCVSLVSVPRQREGGG